METPKSIANLGRSDVTEYRIVEITTKLRTSHQNPINIFVDAVVLFNGKNVFKKNTYFGGLRHGDKWTHYCEIHSLHYR